jgi:uncharacterized protein (DUF433 family)
MSQDGPDLIVVDPEICGGKPVVRGTRVPVEQLVRLARKGYYSEKRIAEEFDLSESLVKKVIKAVQRTPSVKFA